MKGTVAMRSRYMLRFIGRLAVFCVLVILYFWRPQDFEILEGWNFFEQFSVLHIIWLIWIVDIVRRLFPTRKLLLGSQKIFAKYFQAGGLPEQRQLIKSELKEYISSSNYACLKVAAVWVALILVLASLYWLGIFDRKLMLMLTGCFYVCDLICILFWCPFRVLFLKNRCCTTCRIFNWDHIMMCSPLLFIGGFYAWSLCALAALVFVIWELCIITHPERFWEYTNESLQCKNCKDLICGNRYCDY